MFVIAISQGNAGTWVHHMEMTMSGLLARRAAKDETPDEMTRLLADLRTVLATVRPASLTAAESRLAGLRADRARLLQTIRDASGALRAPTLQGGPRPDNPNALARAITDAQREIAGIDERIGEARRAMTEQREAFAVRYARAIGPHRRAACRTLIAALEDIAPALAVLHEADAFAIKSGIQPPHPASPRLDLVAALAASRHVVSVEI